MTIESEFQKYQTNLRERLLDYSRSKQLLKEAKILSVTSIPFLASTYFTYIHENQENLFSNISAVTAGILLGTATSRLVRSTIRKSNEKKQYVSKHRMCLRAISDYFRYADLRPQGEATYIHKTINDAHDALNASEEMKNQSLEEKLKEAMKITQTNSIIYQTHIEELGFSENAAEHIVQSPSEIIMLCAFITKRNFESQAKKPLADFMKSYEQDH
jgi:hypothetical protein